MDIEKYFIANTLATFENKYGRIQLVSADSDIRQNEKVEILKLDFYLFPIVLIVVYHNLTRLNDFINFSYV